MKLNVLLPAMIALASPALLGAQEGAEWPSAAISAHMDSALVAGKLSRLPATREPNPAWVFAIDYTRAGTASRVRMYMTQEEPAGAQADVARILLANARPRPATRDSVPLLVTAVPGRRPVLRAPAEWAPEVRNLTRITLEIERAAARLVRDNPALAGMQSTVHIRMRVDAEGVPGEVTVLMPGNPVIDQEGMQVARAFRFRPGRVEGRPMGVWVEIPLVFRFP